MPPSLHLFAPDVDARQGPWCMLCADDTVLVYKTNRWGINHKLELWSSLEIRGFRISQHKKILEFTR